MDDRKSALLKLNEILTDIETAVISNPMQKSSEVRKIKIEKVTVKGESVFQFMRYTKTQVMHENHGADMPLEKLLDTMMNEGFKQCDITGNYTLTLLMNKDRQFKITGVKENVNYSLCTDKEHNRKKNYILKDKAVPWMIKLGLMDENGVVISSMQKKYRQINRFLEMLADVEKYLPENCTVIDMGCGKSYLTFAMYHYFNVLKNKNVTITGFDLKKDVVEHCNKLAEEFGFDKLKFYNRDIAEIDDPENKIGMIITLHACNTATDIALFHGIRWGCSVIMSVPCCQHEIFPQLKKDSLSPITEHGILRERFAALATDGIRAKILEIMGYKTSVMEFIDMEHTPKNIMIRAVKGKSKTQDAAKKAELDKFMEEYKIEQTLYNMCFKK
jgi:Methyltransferase domain.